ncbi:MAG: hypothetical protein U1E42_13500 [Rhodospirillales bacterium]
MEWTHTAMISTAEAATAVVVAGDGGWEAFPFGLDGGSAGVFGSREAAIETVEGVLGDMVCCVGHLAADADGEGG